MAELKIEDDDEGRRKLWRKTAEGEWEEVKTDPLSDDPEVEAMGSIDVDEFERILEDTEHPKHELVKEHSRLSGERVKQSMAPFLKDIGAQYSSIFKDIIGPKILSDPSVIPDAAKVGPDFAAMSASRFSMPELPVLEPIRNPTFDVLEEQRALNAQILETNKHLADMVRQAKEDATEQKALLQQQIDEAKAAADDQAERAMDEHTRAIEAWWVAWIAIAVTGLVGVGQLAFSALPYLAR